MYRLCLLGCALLLAACGEKAPDEGAIRVSVTYGSFKPACVRVEAKDAKGNQAATDILSSQFKNAEKNEVLVAVRRKADWDTAMGITVSSYAESSGSQCSGEVVERFTNASLTIAPKQFTRFDVTLKAADEDRDGFPSGIEWANADCDDTRSDIHPGAVETCTGTEDLNCNQRVGCQEQDCVNTACDDGNPCTDSDRCTGTGPTALCLGAERTCSKAATCMQTSGTCNKATGECEFKPQSYGSACVDSQTCTINDFCDGSGACVGGTPTPCPARTCFLAATSGCVANNDCNYPPDPAQVNTACVAPANQRPGWCRTGDGACSTFPYRPSNFDPDAVPAADIAALITTAEVTFNTDTLTWAPENAVTNRNTLKPRLITTLNGGISAVLLPVSSLTLGGTLRFVGSAPIILAVYGDANPGQSILANGRFDSGATVRGAGGNHGQCGSATGVNGGVASSKGEGGGGGGNATAGAAGGVGYSGGTTRSGGNPQNNDPLLLQGGCAGGDGGGTGTMAGGRGGAGGGALQLSVARTLTLQKPLSTSGGGGAGAIASRTSGAGGGGGGGSGGRLVVEAFAVNLTAAARLTANGGGGGEGATFKSNNEDNGANASSGSVDSATPAPGGSSASESAGNGGQGAARNSAAGQGQNGGTTNNYEGAGGGGGGAVGFIHLRGIQSCTVNAAAVISPSATGGCTQP
ncbi:putative metal-binding motif-containing protein [Corallococcus exiguus]|uniref:putative metal-binding motif-containing protein n=1 Tax=Corallococcus exiguus TaxID=83462 RepID=UPI001A8C0565|nr:putative metal-binding motif-containing protein [Corallococcus exiguus]MBN8467779.1 putative metal-binding motif-containing protein [Corallococcus exiguus]